MSKAILVIDDSPTVRRLIGSALRRRNYTIHEAADGHQGLEMLASVHVDAVIVDLNMPHMDGLQFTREVRASELHKALPIVMLTTESTAEDEKRGLDAGVNKYLRKPVGGDVLYQALDDVMA